MEIQLYEKLNDPISAIEKVGAFFAKSGMFGCEKTEQGMVLAMACLAEKKSPLEIKRSYHLLNGELSMRADAMLAQFRIKGGKHRVIERTADKAAVELEMDKEKQTFTFTWEMAQKEPFVWSREKDREGKPIPKKNWNTPRARMQMLWARVISDAVRTMAPEIVAGTYTPEEQEDEPVNMPAPKPLFTPAEQSHPINVVDVAANVSPMVPPAEQPPVATTAAPTTPNGVVAEMIPDTKKLTPETVTALETAIGEPNALKALEWLKTQGWIKANLSELSVKRANAILKRPEAFLAEVNRVTPVTP